MRDCFVRVQALDVANHLGHRAELAHQAKRLAHRLTRSERAQPRGLDRGPIRHRIGERNAEFDQIRARAGKRSGQRVPLSVAQRRLHRVISALPFGIRRGDVMGIRGFANTR